MKINIIFSAIAFFATALQLNAHEYSKISTADMDFINGKLVRFLVFEDPDCIFVQDIELGGQRKVKEEKALCSADGKKFSTDYAYVEFKAGFFKENRLFFRLGLTPLYPTGETIKICEVVFAAGVADHLTCLQEANVADG